MAKHFHIITAVYRMNIDTQKQNTTSHTTKRGQPNLSFDDRGASQLEDKDSQKEM